MTDNLCPGREETIYLYLDGALSQAERAEFVTHRQRCPACQQLLAELQTLFNEFTSLQDLAAPPELVAQVMAHLPTAPASARRVAPAYLALAAQIIGGLVLLVLAQPVATLAIGNLLLWQPWQLMIEIVASLAGGLAEAADSLGGQLQAQWPPELLLVGFDLSPPLGLVLIAGLGLAWFIGNQLLLNIHSSSLKNGGAS